MNSLEFLSKIQKIEVPLFTTRELAALFGISEHSVGNYFSQLKSQSLVERVSRGKWVLRCSKLDVLQVADFLTAPKESYISLQSALFYHGLIEQIPSRIYAVTLDRTKVVQNPLGVYSFHHCHPEFFTGYEYIKPYLKVANMEKAFIDYLYFSPSKSRQFVNLPEIEFPRKFSQKKALALCQSIPSIRTRSLVHSRCQALFQSPDGFPKHKRR